MIEPNWLIRKTCGKRDSLTTQKMSSRQFNCPTTMTSLKSVKFKHAVDSSRDGKLFIGSLLLPRCHNATYKTELCHLSINSGRLLRGFVRSDSETMAAKPARKIHDRRGWKLSEDFAMTPLQKCMAQIQVLVKQGLVWLTTCSLLGLKDVLCLLSKKQASVLLSNKNMLTHFVNIATTMLITYIGPCVLQ